MPAVLDCCCLGTAADSNDIAASGVTLGSFQRQAVQEAAAARLRAALAATELRRTISRPRLTAQAERDAVAIADEAAVAEYAALAAARAEAAAAARAALTQPAHVLPFLQPGRLVRVLAPAGADAPDGAAAGAPESGAPAAAAAARLASNGEAGASGAGLGLEDEGAWAAVVNFERVGSAKAAPGGGGGGGGGGTGGGGGGGEAGQYIVDVLVNCAPDSVPGRGPRRCA
jgi:ATP-dependent RNA helicase DOB1